MNSNSSVRPLDQPSRCVGSGLVALDIVVERESPDECFVRSGGSCGNVMAILSYLGWESYPISRLGLDGAAKIVLTDLVRFGVNTRFVRQDPVASTPAIIERIQKSKNGHRAHSYKLHCPYCGNYLLKYRTISKEMIQQALQEVDRPQVFYFDRVSRGILNLAKSFRGQGALIVFEPSGVGDENLFIEATSLSHILKYSQERFSDSSGLLGSASAPLEVQTLGRGGLKYRRSLQNEERSPWRCMPAFKVNTVADEAGAGDWCTSGLIHSLGRYGADSFWRTRSSGIEKAMQLGQALAAISCQFTSARGLMYSTSLSKLNVLVRDLIGGQIPFFEPDIPTDRSARELLQMVCSRCRQLSRRS